MDDFYERIFDFKKRHKLNNQVLGAVIGVSGDAFRMSLKRMSFSSLQIKELEQFFALTDKPIVDESDLSSEEVLKSVSEPELNYEDPMTSAIIDKLLTSKRFVDGICKT